MFKKKKKGEKGRGRSGILEMTKGGRMIHDRPLKDTAKSLETVKQLYPGEGAAGESAVVAQGVR